MAKKAPPKRTTAKPKAKAAPKKAAVKKPAPRAKAKPQAKAKAKPKTAQAKSLISSYAERRPPNNLNVPKTLIEMLTHDMESFKDTAEFKDIEQGEIKE